MIRALDPADAVPTLACHLPAGTTTSQAPDWDTRQVAEFLYERMTEAGYVVAYVGDDPTHPGEPDPRGEQLAALVDSLGQMLHDLGDTLQSVAHPETPLHEIASWAESVGDAHAALVDGEAL